MSVITKGKTFANGEQLTAGKLNQLLDAATFNTAAVDNTKTTLSGGAITVAPGGISFTELASALVNDTDAMTDASATTLATSESIKAYVDSQAIGVGQTWQNVASSRSNNTVFQNTTGRPIQVLISYTPDGVTTQSIEVSSDNSTYIQLARIGFDASESGTTFTVPNNHYYKSDGSLTIRTWVELR
jgi:hypothetical protein